MSNFHLPPIASNGVFSVSASCVINAPPEKVWAIMLDFPSYVDWNPFARGQTIVDASKKRLEDQTPAEGKYILISPVHLSPTMDEPWFFQKMSAFVFITTLDPQNYRVAWNIAGMPRFLLHTERWQALSVDEATGQTKYETIEVFGGLLAYLVKLFVRSNLVLGFRVQAESLKKRAEET